MKRVDNVPFYLQPFFLLYGYALGFLIYFYAITIRLTCRIYFNGAALSQQQPVVNCIWHEDLVLYFGVFNRVRKQVWMNHPKWYMKPIHVLLELTGVQHICLGSSGNDGKQALKEVICFLKQGYSTTVACDGPSGPPLQLKPGVLLMSKDATIPVVALRFKSSRSFRLGGWDRKTVPLWFSTITVHVSTPFQVSSENMDEVAISITQFLNL